MVPIFRKGLRSHIKLVEILRTKIEAVGWIINAQFVRKLLEYFVTVSEEKAVSLEVKKMLGQQYLGAKKDTLTLGDAK